MKSRDTLAAFALTMVAALFTGLVPAGSLAAVRQAAALRAPISGLTPLKPAPSVQDPSGCGVGWHMATLPGPAGGWYSTNSISALSSADAWAVGENAGSTTVTPFATHWNGSNWNMVTLPFVATEAGLYGVTAISASDVWADGYYYNNQNQAQMLIMHWDGTVWTTITNLPAIGTAYLLGIASDGPNNIWAVGTYADRVAQTEETLVMHWDGAQWLQVPSPNPSSPSNPDNPSNPTNPAKSASPRLGKQAAPFWVNNILRAVSMSGASDVWAVGEGAGATGTQTLIEHWDGTAWSIVPSPSPEGSSYLKGVRTLPNGEVWAAGYYDVQGAGRRPFALRRSGGAWQSVPVPAVPMMTYYQELPMGLAMSSPTNGWIVSTKESPPYQSMVLHWDGTKWQDVSGDRLPVDGGALFSVESLPTGETWALGTIPQAAPARLLSLRYSVGCAAHKGK